MSCCFYRCHRSGGLVLKDVDWSKIIKRSSHHFSPGYAGYRLPYHKTDPFFRGTDILFSTQEVADPVSLLQQFVSVRRDSSHGARKALFLRKDGSHPTRAWFDVTSKPFSFVNRSFGGPLVHTRLLSRLHDQTMSESKSDDEASPNVELLLQQAFAEADPAPSLLKVLKEHPTYENIVFPLIEYYVAAVENNPSRGQVLASALAKLATYSAGLETHSAQLETHSTELETLLADIFDALSYSVHFIRLDFDELEEAKDYGPKNRFLIHSLLSGLSLKHRLASNSAMYTTIEEGLDPNLHQFYNLLDPGVVVVGACIQLLLHGSLIPTEEAGTYRRSAEVVAKNLKDRKAAGVVKDPHAIQVLELAISHAENGLKPENDRDDVWDLLFPSES